MTNRNKRAAYISFNGGINDVSTRALVAKCGEYVNKRFDSITIAISSGGGRVRDGLYLYNSLISLPVSLTMHNVGQVNSIATALFMAGNERYANPHTSFMFHGVGFDMPAGGRLEQGDLETKLMSVRQDQEIMSRIIRERTNVSEQQISQWWRVMDVIDAARAESVGIIHQVRDFKIPAGRRLNVLSLR